MPFSRFKLLLRNLRHFRAANLAVVAGMAVATAVLAGNDSVVGQWRTDLLDTVQSWLGTADGGS